MSATNVSQPVDASGNVINRAMGVPMVQDAIALVSATTYVDIFDLSGAAYKNRVFTGIAVENLDNDKSIHISFDDGDFASDNSKHMVVGPGNLMTLDSLMFGPGIVDDSTGKRVTKIRAKLSSTEGTQFSGTIDYDNGGSPVQPADGDTISIGGIVYEFSNDGSLANPSGSEILEAVWSTVDLSWSNLLAVVNATDQRVVVTINTGTNILTVTSVGASATDDAYAISTAIANVVVSATLGGGSGGVTPIIHIW